MVDTITSHDAPSGGNVVNQSVFELNDAGLLTKEYQEHSGAKDGGTPYVGYNYDETASSGDYTKGLCPTSVRYPNGRLVHTTYGASDSTADAMNRVAAINADNAGSPGSALAEYSYLGAGAVIEVDYPEPDLRYDLAHGAGDDPYDGLDRFGRVVDLLWYDYGSSTDAVRIQHGYDRAGSRLYREDPVASAAAVHLDELYGYDGANRLTALDRGNLNGTQDALVAASKNFAQAWSLDPTGNWSGFQQDDDGDSTWDLDQFRTSNPVNEVTNITETAGPSWVTPAYNRAGNMTAIPQPADPTSSYTATYDAWNRLAKLEDGANTVAEYIENAKPIAFDDYFTMKHGGTLSLPKTQLLASDFDRDGDTLELINVSAVSAGTLTYDAPSETYTYDPGAFVGKASFTYQVNDGAEDSDVATVFIEVINTAPWNLDGGYQMWDGASLSVPSMAERGTVWDLESVVTAEFLSGPINAVDFNSDGSFDFTPVSFGTYTVSYNTTDGQLNGNTTDITIEVLENPSIMTQNTQGTIEFRRDRLHGYADGYGGFAYTPPTVTVTNTNTNTAPDAVPDGVYRVLHGTVITPAGLDAPTLQDNDYDPDGDTLTYSLFSAPSHGSVTVNADGTFTYTPSAAGYDYVGADSFEYSVTDGVNAPLTATASLEFTNQDPIVDDQTSWHGAIDSANISVSALEPDGDPLTWQYSAPSVGTLEEYMVPNTGIFTFTPPNSNWTGVATFTVTVTDTAGASDTATITINAGGTPPDPAAVVAKDDSNAWWGPESSGNVLSNDTCNQDPPLTASSTAVGIYGSFSLQSDGSYTYDVAPGQEWAFVDAGGEVLAYTVTNNEGVSDSATLRIKPTILGPGGSVSVSYGFAGPPSYTHTVSNGGGWQNGLGSVYAWFTDSGDAMIKPADGLNFASSAEFVGEFWLGKVAEVVI